MAPVSPAKGLVAQRPKPGQPRLRPHPRAPVREVGWGRRGAGMEASQVLPFQCPPTFRPSEIRSRILCPREHQSLMFHVDGASRPVHLLWVNRGCPAARGSLVAQTVKRLPAMQETRVRSLGQEDPLEKEMATHSSTLAWKIPWMEEPGRL